MDKWKMFDLPSDMSGKSFLDVGCWEGNACLGACRRNASTVVGIDICTSPELEQNLSFAPFTFLQMDIMSEKAWSLPTFDVVLSTGVLYHVEHPLSFLMRLRKLTKDGGLLALETNCYLGEPADKPILLFHPESSLDDNPSNWWTPNQVCLTEMLKASGFGKLKPTYRSEGENEFCRLAMQGQAVSTPEKVSLKILPRRVEYMPSSPEKGSRHG
jgi:tRNA (mo5U34)-methyltransferase